MLEIGKSKFKIWDKTHKKMFYYPDCGVVALQNLFSLSNLNDLVVMQFTGTTDGEKDVFEGDIVDFEDDSLGLAIVVLREGCFLFKFLNGRKKGYETCIKDWNFKDCFFSVIGNVFENPELLKEKESD